MDVPPDVCESTHVRLCVLTSVKDRLSFGMPVTVCRRFKGLVFISDYFTTR